MAQATMYFPADFRWGTATAAYQVEGENTNSDWWVWEQQAGKIAEGHRSGKACDWWTQAEVDLDRAAEMGTNAHRLSLDWSRIEPEPSVFSMAALNRYRELLTAMHAHQIEPMVTLHHFVNPQWLVEKGDFDTDVVVDYFQRYAAKVADALGDLVPLWITINEPIVYAYRRYLDGVFPAPPKTGWSAAARGLRNLLKCHAVAYQAIKQARPEAQIGVAKNMAIFAAPADGHAGDRWWAGWLSRLYNHWWLSAMHDGRLRFPLGRGRIAGLAGSYDFIGVNYYGRYYTRLLRLTEREWPAGAVLGDGNFAEIYPEGIFEAIKQARQYGKPIYITANGLPDRADQHRPEFLLTHLREVWRAVNFSWPVMGYYHWTLLDNFAWDRGWTQRFGLLAMDPKTGKRRLRRSGELYRDICHLRGISSQMATEYAPQILPRMFPG